MLKHHLRLLTKGKRKETAHDLGITQKKLSDYITGKIEPDEQTLNKITAYFDVSLEWLYSVDIEYAIKLFEKYTGIKDLTKINYLQRTLDQSFFEEQKDKKGVTILNAIFYKAQHYVWCKYCATWHIHGNCDGHTTAHCQGEVKTPYQEQKGYIIKKAIDLNNIDT